MYSVNVQTDSLLMFAAVKLRLVQASAHFHRWMISIRTEREEAASGGSSCLSLSRLISSSLSSFPQIEAYVLVSGVLVGPPRGSANFSFQPGAEITEQKSG